MTTKTKLTYEQRLAQWADARLFRQVDWMAYELPGHRCDACGSNKVINFRKIEDLEGNQYFVGSNCYFKLWRLDEATWQCYKQTPGIQDWIKQNQHLIPPFQTWHTWESMLEIYLEQKEKGGD